MTSKVFLITEILERILLATHTRTLLTSCQRVCRKWRYLIQDSHSLQAALFFEPVRYKLREGEKAIQNPLITECIFPWYVTKVKYLDSCDADYVCRWASSPHQGMQGYHGAILQDFDHRIDDLFMRENSSWKRMLIHQPPRSTVAILEISKRFRPYSSRPEVFGPIDIVYGFTSPEWTILKKKPSAADHLRLTDLCDIDSSINFSTEPINFQQEGLISMTWIIDLDEERLFDWNRICDVQLWDSNSDHFTSMWLDVEPEYSPTDMTPALVLFGGIFQETPCYYDSLSFTGSHPAPQYFKHYQIELEVSRRIPIVSGVLRLCGRCQLTVETCQ